MFMIEELDIKFLRQFAAYPPTYITPQYTFELLSDIEKNGIKEPVVLAINPFKNTIRLDSGNHRVYLLPVIGILSMPTIAYISDVDIPSPANGNHLYKTDLIKIGPENYTGSRYARPSDVLTL